MRILNSAGKAFTSRRKALRYVAGGRARYIDEHTIEMIWEDRRHQAAVASAESGGVADATRSHGPALRIVPRLVNHGPRVLTPLGFLHYPQRDQTTTRRRAA